MIYIRGEEVAEDKADFVITETREVFGIRWKEGNSFEFKKPRVEFGPDIAYLVFNIHDEPTLYWKSETGHTRDGLSSLSARRLVSFSELQNVKILFFVGADLSAHCYVSGAVYVAASVSPVRELNERESPFTVASDEVPGIAGFLKYCSAKSAALSRFNAVDAIAGLEYQLDFLTTALQTLVAKIPEGERPEWWPAFEASVNGTKSYRLIGIEKALSEISVEKTKARETQIDYYTSLTNG
jgi:hypothetical protein